MEKNQWASWCRLVRVVEDFRRAEAEGYRASLEEYSGELLMAVMAADAMTQRALGELTMPLQTLDAIIKRAAEEMPGDSLSDLKRARVSVLLMVATRIVRELTGEGPLLSRDPARAAAQQLEIDAREAASRIWPVEADAVKGAA